MAGNGDVEALKEAPYPGTGRTVAEELTELIGRIGENMVLRRAARLAVARGAVASYVHTSLAPGLGKIGVLVALQSEAADDALATLARQLAVHVAAANPTYLDVASVPASALDRERAVLRDQALTSGKGDDVVDKMVEGRLRKFYEEVVLLKQAFVLNPDLTVEKALKEAEKDIGAPAKITGFVRFALGEGIDKGATDFAAEVAAAVKK